MKELKRLLVYVFPYKWILGLALACAILVALCTTGFTGFVKFIFDDLLVPTPTEVEGGPGGRSELQEYLSWIGLDNVPVSRETIIYWIPLILILLFLLKGVSSYFATYLMSYIGQSVVRDLRNELFESVQNKPLTFFSNHPTGELISRVISDVERIQYTVSDRLAAIPRDFFTILGLTLLMFVIDPVLTFIALVVGPFTLYAILTFGRILRAISQRSQEHMQNLSNLLKEAIFGVRVVKAFGMEQFEIRRFFAATYQLLHVNLRAAKVMALTSPVMELLGALAAAGLFWYGHRKITAGQMTTGDFSAFLAAAFGMYAPIKQLSKSNNYIQQSLAAAKRTFAVMDEPTEEVRDVGRKMLDGVKDGITFKNVAFRYNHEHVLRDISFTAVPGEVVALVGRSGSGKTTLVNLIPRFYEIEEGSIAIDGVDIRDVSLASLRQQIGIVTQKTILFNDTILHNITYGRTGYTEEELNAALQGAYADRFIAELPGQLNYTIGEEGAALSGGEIQRLAIARALLKDPPILILDEATSALDLESEQSVQKALNNLMEGRTAFVIAHRLTTIQGADRIFVIDQGRIVAQGSHEELMQQEGLYRRLCEMQVREVEEKWSEKTVRQV